MNKIVKSQKGLTFLAFGFLLTLAFGGWQFLNMGKAKPTTFVVEEVKNDSETKTVEATASNDEKSDVKVEVEDSHDSSTVEQKGSEKEMQELAAEQKEESINSKCQPAVIQEVSSLPTLSLEPHEQLDEETISFKMYNANLIGPVYQKNWRMQVVHFEKSSKGVEAVVEFGNTSNEAITLTNEKIKFTYLEQSGEVGNSKITGGSVTVAPNTVERLTITSSSESGRLLFNIGGYKSAFYFFDPKIISDVSPVNAGQPMGYPYVDFQYQVVGNDQFKLQATGVVITNNKSLCSLQAKEGETILLAKVRLANTSNEEMRINEIFTSHLKAPTSENIDTVFKEDVMLSLGDVALPTVIPASTIVEGYIPIIYRDGNDILFISARTNFGPFAISGIERLSAWSN